MKTVEQIKRVLRKYKPKLARKYHIQQMGIFGSYARGDETENSDLDIMVTLEKPIGLDFVTLAEELEKVLETRVDLVSANAIKPRMMKSIKEELVYV